MAEPMSIQVTGLLHNHQAGDIITIRKIDNGDSIIEQWSLDNADDGAVGPLTIQVTGLPAGVNTNAEVTIVKTERIGEHEQWEVQEPVAPAQEPVAPPQEPVGQASNDVDGGRRSRRQGGSKKKKKSKGWGGSKKQKKDWGGSKKQKKRKGSKKMR